jgi:hypothetical protein
MQLHIAWSQQGQCATAIRGDGEASQGGGAHVLHVGYEDALDLVHLVLHGSHAAELAGVGLAVGELALQDTAGVRGAGARGS